MSDPLARLRDLADHLRHLHGLRLEGEPKTLNFADDMKFLYELSALREPPAPHGCECHDSECESESTSHGYTPCRCAERAALQNLTSDTIARLRQLIDTRLGIVTVKCGACGASYHRCAVCHENVRVVVNAPPAQCGGHRQTEHASDCELDAALSALGEPTDVFPAVEDVLAKHCRGYMTKRTTRENIAELIDAILTTDDKRVQEMQQLKAALGEPPAPPQENL